jgi:hypothetical protein
MTQPVETPPAPETKPEPDVDKTFTQADLDRIVGEAKRKAKPADYDELRTKAAEFDKLAEASQTEQEKTASKLAELQKSAESAEARAMRLEVAFDKGLTPAQAKRLVGATREELEADADEILRDFPVKTDGRPKGDADLGGRPKPPPANAREADLRQIEADLNAGRR